MTQGECYWGSSVVPGARPTQNSLCCVEWGGVGDGSIVGIHRSGWVNAFRANSLFLQFFFSVPKNCHHWFLVWHSGLTAPVVNTWIQSLWKPNSQIITCYILFNLCILTAWDTAQLNILPFFFPHPDYSYPETRHYNHSHGFSSRSMINTPSRVMAVSRCSHSVFRHVCALWV